jgi:hypothetical protein
MEEVRERSRRLARRLGYGRTAADLPAPDTGALRPTAAIVDRALVLNVVISCAYGLSTEAALDWLTAEDLFEAVTDGEHEFLVDVAEGLRVQELARRLEVESLFTLLWSVSIVDDLDFDRGAGDVAAYVPDLSLGESGDALRADAQRRDGTDLYAAFDLATVLASLLADEELHVGLSPGDVEPYVIWERRRALAWVHGAEW